MQIDSTWDDHGNRLANILIARRYVHPFIERDWPPFQTSPKRRLF
jgi:hypothetical protein